MDSTRRRPITRVAKYRNHGQTRMYFTALMFRAVRHGNGPLVKRLLRYGVRIHARDHQRRSFLHIDGKFGDGSITRRLVRAGCRINATNRHGSVTALICAAFHENQEVASQLIACGASVHASLEGSGLSALHIAAFKGSVAIVKMLVAAGADINHVDNWSRTVLHCAVGNDNFQRRHQSQLEDGLETIKVLIEAGADIERKDDLGCTVLHCAVMANNVEVVALLLEHRSYVDAEDNRGCTPLHFIANCDIRIIRALLERGADPNHLNTDGGFTPFHQAVFICEKDVVSLFLKHKGDPTKMDLKGQPALYFAIGSPHVEVFELILQCAKINVEIKNSDGMTLLHVASMACRPEFIRKFVAMGASVNPKDVFNNTPLFYSTIGPGDHFKQMRPSVQEDALQSLQLLLELGSDINQKVTSNDQTIFEVAIERSNFDALQVMMKHVANVEARTGQQLLDKFNMSVITSHQESLCLYQEWQTELKTIKKRKIGNTLISYYSVLAEPLEVVSCYARNEELVTAFESSNCEQTFPLYQEQLRTKFNEAVKKRKRSDEAASVLSNWFCSMNPVFTDPTLQVYDLIMKNLTREDVNNIIQCQEASLVGCADARTGDYD